MSGRVLASVHYQQPISPFPKLTVCSIDHDIEYGAFVVSVGSSGCGKSTVLRLIVGLEAATFGQITINGNDVTRAG